AAVRRPGRPAARGTLRADRARRRRLVPRLRAAERRAPAQAGVRAADPGARGQRGRRRSGPAAAHAELRPRVPRGAPARAPGRDTRRGGRVLRDPGGGGRGGTLLAFFAVAKKTKTPPPPRPVQAPKVRTDRGGGMDEGRKRMLVYAFGLS